MNFYILNLSTIFALLIIDQYLEFIPDTGIEHEIINAWLIVTVWSVLVYFFSLIFDITKNKEIL